MSNTPKPTYTPTNVQRFVSLLAADTNLSYAYALFQSAGEISYDEVRDYRARIHANNIELENAKKHLKLAENALQREQGLTGQLKAALQLSVAATLEASKMAREPFVIVDNKDEPLAALAAENDFLKEKVVQLGGTIEGFTPSRSPVKGHWRDATIFVPDEGQGQVTYTFAGMRPSLEDGTWTVTPLANGATLPTPQMSTGDPDCPVAWATIRIIPDDAPEPEAPKPTPNPFASYVQEPKELQYDDSNSRRLQLYEDIKEGDVYFYNGKWKTVMVWDYSVSSATSPSFNPLFRRPINQAEGKP